MRDDWVRNQLKGRQIPRIGLERSTSLTARVIGFMGRREKERLSHSFRDKRVVGGEGAVVVRSSLKVLNSVMLK